MNIIEITDKKILHINSYYVSRNLYKYLYDYQIEHGYHIRVFVPVRKKRIPVEFERGVYTDLSYDFNRIDRFFFHIKHIKIYKDAKKHYGKFPFSFVHAHSLFSNGYIAYRIKKEYGIPYVVTVQNTDVNDFFKKAFFLRGLGNKILQESKAVFFASKAYKNNMLDKYIKKRFVENITSKSFVIPYGIDEFWLKNYPEVPKSRHDNKLIRIISVGEINKNKNQVTSVKACNELHARGYDVKFTVVGKIVDRDIYNLLMEYNFVEYLGVMSKEKLMEEYRKQDIFLMPSITETFGLVYAEALSQGVPIIYTREQGFDEQFENGYVGFSVESNNHIEIAECIEMILEDYSAYSSRCIRSANNFSWDKICKRYKKIYDEEI